MRVLQLIDSLQAGGAERMAVNIANTLGSQIDASFLCSTRKEGVLKKSLHTNVGYLFLNKTRRIDFKAIKVLNTFIRQQDIQIIHAHSTSYFLATIIKFLNRNVKIVWHDHYGNSEYLSHRKFKILRFCSRFFSQALSVNSALEEWARIHLKVDNVKYLPNFAVKNFEKAQTILKGKEGKRIIHLTNFRSQKDHFTLLNAFKNVVKQHQDCTLHCVGKDFNDQYSDAIKAQIAQLKLNDKVFLYGSQPDVFHILSQGDIGVLSSKSEGLPISLLEYGLAGLPVVVTDVGDCAKVVLHNENGIVVPKENSDELAVGLLSVLQDDEKSARFGQRLKLRVENTYSETKYINALIEIYAELV
jgi:glycosyltransferase involved in cell wall biosynthesis